MQALTAEGMPLAEARRRVAQANAQARAVIGECLEAVSHELTFFPLPGCFELFGFDLMLSADWRVWLLEANAEPDFGQVRAWPRNCSWFLLKTLHLLRYAGVLGGVKCESTFNAPAIAPATPVSI